MRYNLHCTYHVNSWKLFFGNLGLSYSATIYRPAKKKNSIWLMCQVLKCKLDIRLVKETKTYYK